MKVTCLNNSRRTMKCRRSCCRKKKEIVEDTTFQSNLHNMTHCHCRHRTPGWATGCCQQVPGTPRYCACDSER